MAGKYIPKQYNCAFCGAVIKRETKLYECTITCPNCGEYFIDNRYEDELKSYNFNKLKSYLYYHKGEKIPYIISNERYKKMDTKNWDYTYNLTPEMVENWYPKTFADKVDKILLAISANATYQGKKVNYSFKDLMDIYFVDYDESKLTGIAAPPDQFIQVEFFNSYFKDTGYLQIKQLGTKGTVRNLYEITLTPKGLSRVDELQRSDVNNKNIFVSMAFNNDTDEIREAIRTAIIAAGYSPEFIDEIIHNHQIMPEMFRLIRECKYLILEITEPNYGAYYEAGYALGLGKEVIICCSKEIFTKDYESGDDKKYAKYLKPHFDIAQKQILVWDDLDDLIKKLPQWIKVLDK